MRRAVSLSLALLSAVAVSRTGDAQRAKAPPPRDPTFWASADTGAVRQSLQRDAELFLMRSRRAWQAAEDARRASRNDSPNEATWFRRRLDFHCHFDGTYNGRDGTRNPTGAQRNLIRAANSRFSICPNWLAARAAPARVDQSVRPDDVLATDSAVAIRLARRALIAAFDSAGQRHPSSRWIIGQRVRFRTDAGALDEALDVARACTAERAFCLGLHGYTLYRLGRVAEAESAFLAMGAQLAPDARCAWGSVQPLLARAVRDDYDRLGCAGQDSLTRTIWWLADPMFIEPGNERRAEHYARRVRQALHEALPFDEFHDLRRNEDAVGYMHVRYGWPSYLYWAGSLEEGGHTGWLAGDYSPPYTAPEYSPDRVATFPMWEAVIDPFTAGDDDFELGPPDETTQEDWWPWEHFRRARGPIVTVDAGQIALFRRDSAALFVVATALAAPQLTQRVGERVDASLVLSRDPGHLQILAAQRMPLGARAIMRARVDSGRAIAGIEFLARTRGTPDGRSRFGVTIPTPLAAMPADAAALSDLLLFQVPGGEVPMPDDAESAIEQMYGSMLLHRPRQVGVFWESYGFRPGDTVSVAVRVERITSVGKLRRLGMALRVASDPNGTIGVSWREPSPERYTRTIPAVRPTIARQITLDLSSLVAGDYRMQVTMQRAGAAAVSTSRTLKITR